MTNDTVEGQKLFQRYSPGEAGIPFMTFLKSNGEEISNSKIRGGIDTDGLLSILNTLRPKIVFALSIDEAVQEASKKVLPVCILSIVKNDKKGDSLLKWVVDDQLFTSYLGLYVWVKEEVESSKSAKTVVKLVDPFSKKEKIVQVDKSHFQIAKTMDEFSADFTKKYVVKNKFACWECGKVDSSKSKKCHNKEVSPVRSFICGKCLKASSSSDNCCGQKRKAIFSN